MAESIEPDFGMLDATTKTELLHEMFSSLRAIHTAMDDEIKVRFRRHPSKTEEQLAGKSVIYSILAIPRNISGASISKVLNRLK